LDSTGLEIRNWELEILKKMAIHIKNILDRNIREAGIKQPVTAAIICDEFNKLAIEIIGEKIRDKAKALYLKNRTLTVAVLSSVIGQELKLHEKEILEKLNKKLGENVVDRIRFFV